MIKRYLVFAGHDYYPSGGWSDFISSFDDVSEAHVCALKTGYDWWQVVDTQTGLGFDNNDQSPNNKEVIQRGNTMEMNEEKERNYQLEIIDLRLQLIKAKSNHLELMRQYNQLAKEHLDFIRSSNERLTALTINIK